MVNRSRSSSITRTGTFQRAGIACQSCRLRKVKCDAQSVSADEPCSPCRRAGQECLLDPLSDGRRSVNRKYVDKLQQRIENLEALSQSSLKSATEGSAWRTDDIDAVPPRKPSVVADNVSSHTAKPTQSTGVGSPPPIQNISSSKPAPATSSSRQAHSTMVPISTSGKSPQITNTSFGSPSFYGATSHPHLVSASEESSHNSCEYSEAVEIELDPLSPHLRDDLFQSFFKYQTLWIDIVNKESFLTHQEHGNESRWYSKFLENAILASSARLSTSKAVRALGSKFYEWAKMEAFNTISEPTPAALQGFLLLSEYEVTQGNDRPGWMFCGVACRMISDLGLHELASNDGRPGKSKDSIKESDLAYALISACVVYEGVWTLYLGRPSSIPRSVMNVAFSRSKEERKSDSIWSSAWVGLCVPMAEVSRVLNDQSISDYDRSVSLRTLFKEVEEWYDGLPQELAYNESRLTNMDLAGYGIHTQYCKVQILLRRALARSQPTKKRRYSQITSDSDSRTSADDSDVIIYRYALRIARLFITYREAFGVEKIPSILLDNAVVAATAMIAHLNNTNSQDGMQQDTIWLRQLVRSLDTVQPHFPIVGRMLEALKQICGISPLCSILPFASRVSTIQPPVSPLPPPPQQLPVLGLSKDMESLLDDIQSDIIVVGDTGRDFVWDAFDMEVDSSMFFAGGLDNFVFDLPASDKAISGSTHPTNNRPQGVS